jgi:hypothetical protein
MPPPPDIQVSEEVPMLKHIGASLVLLGAMACGGSTSTPTAPTPTPANVAGTWSGTFGFTAQAPFTSGMIPLTMNLTQAGSSVSGTWVDGGASGTVSGATTTTSFSGTFTWNAILNGATVCIGTFAVSGSAGGNTVNWTSPGLTTMTGICPGGGPTNITITAARL